MTKEPQTVAIVAMGEMGSAIGARLAANGARILTSLAGRSRASVERARAVGIEAVEDRRLIENADIFLSIVPPHAAMETAERFLPLCGEAMRKPVFFDCNAVSPKTASDIADACRKEGVTFVDAGIIGGPPLHDGPGPRVYVAGDAADEIEWLRKHGLDLRYLSSKPGEASALKMAYAGITKGFQALGASMALGAARSGLSQAFADELSASQPELFSWLARQLPKMPSKAYRWDGEMREIARFLESERGSAAMFVGASQLYADIAEASGSESDSEFVSAIGRFVRSGSA